MKHKAGLKHHLQGACTQNQLQPLLKPVKGRPAAPLPNRRRLRSYIQLAKTPDHIATAGACTPTTSPPGTSDAGQSRGQPMKAKILAPVPLQPSSIVACVSEARQPVVDEHRKNNSLKGTCYNNAWHQNPDLDIALDQSTASSPMLLAQDSLQRHRVYNPCACHENAMEVRPSVPAEQIFISDAAAAIGASLRRHMSLSGWCRSLVHSKAPRPAPGPQNQSYQLRLQSAQETLQPDAPVTACKMPTAMGLGAVAVTLSESRPQHESFVQVLLRWKPTQGPHKDAHDTTGYLECSFNVQHMELPPANASETQQPRPCGASQASV